MHKGIRGKRAQGCMAWDTGEKPRGNEAGQTDGFWVLKEVWNVLGRWRAWSLGSLGAVWVRVDPRKPLLHAEEAQSWHDSQSYRSANQVAGFETTPGEFDGVGLQARLARRTPPERLPAQDLWAGADETHVVLPIKTSRSGNKAHREPEWSVRRRWVTPRGRRAWLRLGCQSGSEDSAVRAGRIDGKGWGCVCLSVCVSVCVCLYECVGVWGCMCTCLWRLEVNRRHHSSDTIHLSVSLQDRVSHRPGTH